jgi:hypothetical protein
VTGFASPPRRGDGGAQSRTDCAAVTIVSRLGESIRRENEAMATRAPIDHRACGLRKSQALLELERLGPSLGAAPSPALRAALDELAAALEDNQRRLRVQLSAAKAVSEIVARAIREGQSDGTYCEYAWGGRDE